MPLAGGEIRQLTYHQSADRVSSWSWDNSMIYFTSDRENRMSTYSISVNGGTPKRLFSHYFNNVHNVMEHPKTDEIFFNESWESKNFTHRKRYKGDYNPDIKSYNSATKTFKEYKKCKIVHYLKTCTFITNLNNILCPTSIPAGKSSTN